MKKLFLTMCVALFALGASAQTDEGDKAIGAKATYAFDQETIGIGVVGRYNIKDKVRIEGDLDYFLKKNDLSMWDINAFAHYLLPIADTFTFYPLAGVGLTNWKVDLDQHQSGLSSSTSTDLAIYLGAGADYYFQENLGLNLEIKYQIVNHHSQALFSAGIIYKF